MAFDWLNFLDANRIHYVTTGPNVSHGHVAVHCPMCGTADPSQHMAISLTGGGWKCWRSADHRGKAPAYLVASLLGIPVDRAHDMVGGAVFIPEDFIGTVRAKMAPPEVKKIIRLKMPDEFKPIIDRWDIEPAIQYLEGRGFAWRDIKRFTEVYGLRYAVTGKYRGRIVFPIYEDGVLKTWTARAIHKDVELRYKTLSTKPELEEHPAAGPINDYLLWQDDIRENVDRSETLLLCEGPFDALKLRVIGARLGCEATCFFTSSPSRLQMDILHDIGHRYRRRFLLLDQKTLGNALRAQSNLVSLGVGVLHLPAYLKDPGEMRVSDLQNLLLAA